MLELAGYLASALTGVILGLTGGGGSILTIPILVYLFHISPLLATSYSLFTVGCSSIVGAYHYGKSRSINLRALLYYGIPSVATVSVLRSYLIPYLKNAVVHLGSRELKTDDLMMLAFALLIIISSVAIIRTTTKAKQPGEFHDKVNPYFTQLVVAGIATGAVSGLLGAGGGFLIVPALVLFMGLAMKDAIGTSLLLIAVNSSAGFATDLTHFNPDWPILIKITLITISGVFVGHSVGTRLNSSQLKKAFGYFSLVLGLTILVKELSVVFVA